MINSVTFGAKKIGTLKVLKLSDGKYVPYDADIVSLKPGRNHDIRNIAAIQNDWNTFLSNRLLDLCTTFNLNIFNRKHIILLCEPQNYDKNNIIDTQKILGFSLFTKRLLGKHNELSLLETNPKYRFGRNNRYFTNIGKGLLNFWKKKFNKKPFDLTSSDNAIKFYEKNGLNGGDKNHFTWNG